MAGAEARAAWQRTANRCFVQEDAKRAPKLAFCQSSSAASTKQVVDSGPTGSVDPPDNYPASLMPLNQNPFYSNITANTKWWRQMHPNYIYQTVYEDEMEIERARLVNLPFKHDDSLRHDAGSKKNLKTFEYKNVQEFVDSMEMKEKCVFMEMDAVGFPGKLNELYFEPESPWISAKRAEPWWRITDKDELASLVAQKSLDYIENCDLPPPQKVGSRSASNSNSLRSNGEQSYQITSGHNSPKSVITPRKQRASVEAGCMHSGSWNSFSYNSADQKNATRETQASENDLVKAQLLDAIRHSQTRAREAELAAKQAYAERDHVVTLFFKQASQLFAYKQWFQLLQLEALYLQIKANDKPISTLSPAACPWMPCKGRKSRKSWQKGKRGKLGGQRAHDVTRYAVAFAIGLGLVGAGLLLGWTVGWMLPF